MHPKVVEEDGSLSSNSTVDEMAAMNSGGRVRKKASSLLLLLATFMFPSCIYGWSIPTRRNALKTNVMGTKKHYFSTLLFATTMNDGNGDYDFFPVPSKQQQQQQEQQETELSSSTSSSEKNRSANKRHLLLTFDLDDTLWHTGKVVRAANDVMIQTIQEQLNMFNGKDDDGFDDDKNEDLTVSNFIATTKSIRQTLTEPITYGNLRKLAIRETLLRHNYNGGNIVDDYVVDMCYESWVDERNAAAERYLLPNAMESLRMLQDKFGSTSKDANAKVVNSFCVAAITNGAGSPLNMPSTLQQYFEFCVSGEDSDVFPNRKPHPYIYEYTLQQYYDRVHSNSQVENKDNPDELIWCHVGDCLANDVSASNDCGAYAIWMCTEDDQDSAATRLTNPKQHPEWSTAPKEEMDRRAQLVEQGKSKITATIKDLSELPNVIAKIVEGHEENSKSSLLLKAMNGVAL